MPAQVVRIVSILFHPGVTGVARLSCWACLAVIRMVTALLHEFSCLAELLRIFRAGGQRMRRQYGELSFKWQRFNMRPQRQDISAQSFPASGQAVCGTGGCNP
ncbi:hypothetical protein KCP73_01760 [Salmonella enterica subsp. enterica]|nr:hypothetical protein KCP73_01760 [Salmonella enterica subsp. enterica]